MMSGELPDGWDDGHPELFARRTNRWPRASAGGKVINAIAARVPELVGGSADLNPSTDTALKGAGDFQSPAHPPDGVHQGAVGGEWGYGGRNLHFGVREHAMGRQSRGMALHGGVIPFGATFLIFCRLHAPVHPPGGADEAARRSTSSPTTASAWARTARRTSRSSRLPRCARSRT